MYQVYKYETWIFVLKNTLNDKNALFEVCSIVIRFSQHSDNLWIPPSKNLRVLLQTIHRGIFSNLATNQSAAQQVREVANANKW